MKIKFTFWKTVFFVIMALGVYSTYVRYLVRVADGGYGAVHNRQSCEFRGDKHRTFNMDVTVNEARKNIVVSSEL